MDLKLRDKRALVAGASRGLGYAIALGLAREGCNVAINGRNAQSLREASLNLIDETHAEVITVVGDVSHPDVPRRLVSKTVQAFGGLDLLVTNAGGPPSGKFENFDDPVWLQAINHSLLSHVRLIRAALPELRKSDCASVVTMTSYSVKQPIPNLVLSNSIRLATIGLTKTLSQELGGDGIRFAQTHGAKPRGGHAHHLLIVGMPFLELIWGEDGFHVLDQFFPLGSFHVGQLLPTLTGGLLALVEHILDLLGLLVG